MKLLKPLFLFFLLHCSIYVNAQTLNIFVSAHPDDWQLFMNPNAYHSLDSIENKSIFLHITAGDAGAAITNDYYRAREEGSLRAIRFMVNAQGNKDGYGNTMKADSSKINGHPILNYQYGNAKAYFLRLHDGYIVGNDTMVEHQNSLKRFYESKEISIPTITKNTTYKNLSDLKTTLSQLIEKESTNLESVTIHVAQTDVEKNPGDHIDHLHTSLILQEVAENIPNSTVYLYQEYSSSEKPLNIFPEDFLISAGTWGATASGLSDFGHYPTWDSGHNAWIGRQYYWIKE